MDNSKKTYFPPNLNIFFKKEYLVYFLIGFIDGDGSISKNRSCSIGVHEN